MCGIPLRFLTDYSPQKCMNKETTKKEDGFKVYEIGYHLVPSIPAEKVAAEVDAIKALITKHKGEFIADEFPKLRPLAFMMKKDVDGMRHKYTEAYFGWVKFEIESGEIAAIKSALDINKKVLRFLLVTTVRENTYLGQKAIPTLKEEVTPAVAEEAKPAEAAPTSVEEIDKTIDDMVKEG